MSVVRFFAPDATQAAGPIALPADEAHHLSRVLRLDVGAAVRVFDGRGAEWEGTVASVTSRGATVAIHAAVTPVAEPPVQITVAAALLKGDHMDAVVRDATMLGAAAIAPLASTHVTVAQAAWRTGGPIARWHRVAVAAAKQCGRAVVPAIAPVAAMDAVLRAAQSVRADRVIMAVEPAHHAGAPAGRSSGGLPPLRATDARPARALLLLGPEGGWTHDEIALAGTFGAVALRLGPRTLRAETAPVVALSTLWGMWGWV